jgi:hypothetical protein
MFDMYVRTTHCLSPLTLLLPIEGVAPPQHAVVLLALGGALHGQLAQGRHAMSHHSVMLDAHTSRPTRMHACSLAHFMPWSCRVLSGCSWIPMRDVHNITLCCALHASLLWFVVARHAVILHQNAVAASQLHGPDTCASEQRCIFLSTVVTV